MTAGAVRAEKLRQVRLTRRSDKLLVRSEFAVLAGVGLGLEVFDLPRVHMGEKGSFKCRACREHCSTRLCALRCQVAATGMPSSRRSACWPRQSLSQGEFRTCTRCPAAQHRRRPQAGEQRSRHGGGRTTNCVDSRKRRAQLSMQLCSLEDM